LKRYLPEDEHSQGQAPDRNQDSSRQRSRRCADTNIAQSIDDATESQGRQNHRDQINARMVRRRHVLDAARTERQGTEGDRQHKEEQPAPIEIVQDESRDGRADRRRHRYDRGNSAHGLAASFRGRQHHDRGHEQRHHDRSPGCLNDAREDQHFEIGSQRSDQRAQREQRHRQDKDRPRIHPLQQKPGDRNDHGHGEKECRGQPLHGTGRDIEVSHEPRDGNGHEGFVENYNESGDQEQIDDQPVASGGVGKHWGGDIVRGQVGGTG